MSNVVMCRVCLVADVRMHVIINTPFQDIFTKFTDITISPEDGKPGLLCYICHTLLRKCFKFYNKALQADKLLTQVIQGGVVKAESVPVLNTHTHKQLCVSPIEVISYKDPPETVGLIEVPVKEEVPIKREVKQEKCEEPEHSDLDDNVWQSDSDDNIPLKNFSLKKSEKVKVRLKRDDRGRIPEFAREIILTKEQQLQELVDRSKSVNYINSPLKCELCFKGFIDVNAYDNHRDKHDEKSGAHECDVCHMRYKTQRQLRTHCATSHSRQYACVKCTHRSHTANQAREHEQWHDGYTYECKLCGQKFRKHTSYLTHKRKRHPTQHVCPICGHSFVGRHGLLMHQSKAHRLIDKQPEVTEPASDRHCSRCGIQFVTRHAWQRHVLSASARQGCCDNREHCGIQFVTRHAWQRHVLSASARQGCCDNSLTCRICDVTFPSRVALLSHFKEHERSLRTSKTSMPRAVAVPLACDQCGANFVNRSKLQAHVKRIHLGVKYNKNIVCEVCGKKCTSNASLKYHQRTHTGEKPYQCSTCPKRFADKNQLRIHTRTHTGERPYCCTVCGKRFSQKPALNRHYRVHTGDKPYVCQFCSKTFTQSNSLKLHVRTVHLKMTSKRKAPAAIDKVEDTAVQAL